MNLIPIKKIALSTITISLNIVLPTQAWALSEVNHQSLSIIDNFSPEQLSYPYIVPPVLSKYTPPNNGGPDQTDATGTR
ncbi:MAG: hypothetical protein QNJ68_08875 [Microcoleaceae cyanobacterium MO_207.B10]|nr:hypothetical protein [Microcoleaceae cyanobacterium MO_207.B10]